MGHMLQQVQTCAIRALTSVLYALAPLPLNVVPAQQATYSAIRHVTLHA